MLYQSLYQPNGSVPLSPDVVTRPELAKYVSDWGRDGDLGFVAVNVASDRPVGAAWLRVFSAGARGYGFVDDETPELGIAVLPHHRGRGVGTALLLRLLQTAGGTYKSLTLSVSTNNPAVRLYERLGFRPVGKSGTSVTMLKHLEA